MVSIGDHISNIEAQAVINQEIVPFILAEQTAKYVVLFFYPLDFTFVCPTELHAFQDRLEDFTQRQALVVGCSVDSVYAHAAWLRIPRSQGGIEGVTYPLLSDITKKLAGEFGVLHAEKGIAYRGLFILDSQRIIRHLLINDFPIGRSVDEALRVVDALEWHDLHGDVCPANWNRGDQSMTPSTEGIQRYFSYRENP